MGIEYKKYIVAISIIFLIVLAGLSFGKRMATTTATPKTTFDYLKNTRLVLSSSDEQRHHVMTVTSEQIPVRYSSAEYFWQRDKALHRWYIYRIGYFIGSSLIKDDNYELWAPLLQENQVTLLSNHTWTGQSRYSQWDIQITDCCELGATLYNYRLIASIFDRPVAWLYQTNTDENGTPFNNKIMDATNPPSSSVYRTWYYFSLKS